MGLDGLNGLADGFGRVLEPLQPMIQVDATLTDGIKCLIRNTTGYHLMMEVVITHVASSTMRMSHHHDFLYAQFHHEMIARGVTDETLDTIRKCGINLDHWLEGFKDTPESVRKTVETIKTHPLVPKDIVVRGFIIDSETGALEEIL